MVVSEEHAEKAQTSICITLFGIIIIVSDEHFLKAHSPISVTPSGIMMF